MKGFIKFLSLIVLVSYSFLANAQWVQLGADIVDDPFAYSGKSVSISSDGLTVAIGADYKNSYAGQVRIYKYISGVWVQQGGDINGEAVNDLSGYSIELSADGLTVAIGARYNGGNGFEAGHVRVYSLISGVWTQLGQDIDGDNAGDNAGYIVDISADGSIVAVGAPYNAVNGLKTGHVRVFELIAGVWIQMGFDLDGYAAEDEFGYSLSLSDDGLTMAVSAPFYDGPTGSTTMIGYTQVYNYNGSSWVQVGADIEGEAIADASGSDVSLSDDGSIVSIGAVFNDGNGNSSGHVRAFQFVGGVWTQLGQDIDGENVSDFLAYSHQSADGLTMVTSTPFNDANGSNSGHARVYDYTAGTWVQRGTDIDGDTTECRLVDAGLSDDGYTLVLGAAYSDINGTNSGLVRVYGFCGSADTTTSLVVNTVTANQNGASYQWLDCNNGYAPIVSETNQSYTPTVTGSYAVEIKLGHCIIDTSACVDFTPVGIAELSAHSVSVYPNPATYHLTIDTELILQEVDILDLTGKTIATYTSNLNNINVVNLHMGIYFIKLVTDEKTITKKFVKQ